MKLETYVERYILGKLSNNKSFINHSAKKRNSFLNSSRKDSRSN